MRDTTQLPHTRLPYGQLWNGSSGNYSPENQRSPFIDTIVLHTTVGTLAGTASWFNNPNSKVSANYGVDTDGKIYSFVPENCVAFHAGVWAVNKKSIGIEHIDNGNPQAPRTEEQIQASAQLVADICRAYNIPCDREHIKKHGDIKATSCPGNLPIDTIIERAQRILNPSEPMHTYEMPESVFNNMVSEGSEYRKLFEALQLDIALAKGNDSHKIVIDDINRRVSEAVSKASQNHPVTPPQEVIAPTPSVSGASGQDISVWRVDVLEKLKGILDAVRGR